MTKHLSLLLALFLLILFFSLLNPLFFSTPTIQAIGNQIPDLTFLAVALTLVMITGGIDLSVGSLLALCSSIIGVHMISNGASLSEAFLISLFGGALCGLITGTITTLGKIPSFIVTLGMLECARGVAYLVTDSQTVYIGSEIGVLAESTGFLGVSPMFILAIVIVVLGQLLLSRTVYGRYLVAIGTNLDAVRLSGINPTPYQISVFIISGTLCAFAALSLTARLASSDPNAAIGLELSAIAAAVIGGTSLMGGRGSVIGSFIGVLIIAVLQTGLASMGVDEPTKRIITGAVIVFAALMDFWRTKQRRA